MKTRNGSKGLPAIVRSSALRISFGLAVAVIATTSAYAERSAKDAVKGKPTIANLEVFSMKRAMKDGKNAVMFVNFSKGQSLRASQSIKYDGKKVTLNDKGLKPDMKAGDGTFTGYAKINKSEIISDTKAYKRRLAKMKGKPVVHEFSGRGIISTVAYDSQKPPRSKLKKSALPKSLSLTSMDRLTGLPALLAPTFSNDKVLAINDLSVVQDPTRTFIPCSGPGNAAVGAVDGAWSFKTLMKNMGNATTDAETRTFVFNWVQNWMADQSVNGQTIPKRTNLANFFANNDGSLPWDGTQANLNIDKLPFRLLSIMNRMDLGKVSPYGNSGNSGETRFVFGLVNLNGLSCSTKPMTTILEYGNSIPGQCSSMKSFANKWIALNDLPLPSTQYNAALQALTDTVTLPNMSPHKPLGSAINQVRTNEITFGSPWQLREFTLSATNGLVSSALAQTPIRSLSGSTELGNFINANLVATPTPNPTTGTGGNVLCTNYIVPESFSSSPFAAAFVNYSFNQIWQIPAGTVNTPSSWPLCYNSEVVPPLSSPPSVEEANSEIRQHISLNTCDDCHAGETQTTFTHIIPSGSISAPAGFSGFLTGITVQDPEGATRKNLDTISRNYNDLARRAQILQDLATRSCFRHFGPDQSFFGKQQRMHIVH